MSSSIHATLAAPQSPNGWRTLDTDADGPAMAAVGVADELAPGFDEPRYQQDADAFQSEIDEMRNTIASFDLTPAEFHALVSEQCPRLIATCSSHAYVHVDCLPGQPAVSEMFNARANFGDGSRPKNIEAASWRQLAERLAREYAAREAMGRPGLAAAV